MMHSEDKLCVVVLFGGMSSEHEVSRVSAGTFVDNLDRARYEVLTVGITREGRWLPRHGQTRSRIIQSNDRDLLLAGWSKWLR